MAQAYFSLVTTAGRNKLASSAAGGPAVSITHFAIGDGNGADTIPPPPPPPWCGRSGGPLSRAW